MEVYVISANSKQKEYKTIMNQLSKFNLLRRKRKFDEEEIEEEFFRPYKNSRKDEDDDDIINFLSCATTSLLLLNQRKSKDKGLNKKKLFENLIFWLVFGHFRGKKYDSFENLSGRWPQKSQKIKISKIRSHRIFWYPGTYL